MRLSEPQTPQEFDRYYEVRWQILRAPWGQARGSEKDEYEDDAMHLMMCLDDGLPVAVGRLHRVDEAAAQIRYMAVLPAQCRQGCGRAILAGLEAGACLWRVRRVVLNARALAAGFYERHGYHVKGAAPMLFGEIEHVAMEKVLG